MVEILAFINMQEIDLITSLERISSKMPNRLLKLEGYILKKNCKERLEIIIYKGFSSSTTHPIEVDLDKKVIEFDYSLSNFKLYKAPLTKTTDKVLREHKNSHFFLKQKNWI